MTQLRLTVLSSSCEGYKGIHMKKYTVVYDAGFMSGSHYAALTRFALIETDNLLQFLKEEDRFSSSVHFVFDGWLEVSSDWLQKETKNV